MFDGHAGRFAVVAFVLLFAEVIQAANTTPWIETYNRLLRTYVTDNGVKYAMWKNNAADMQAIEEVADAIARKDVSSLGKKDQLAFYLNAYNAWILHEALAKYPTKSVKDPLF